MKTKYKYIEMEKIIIKNKKRKTDIYSVKSKSSAWEIGKIKWFPSWRQYCFFPESNTIFSKGCLDDISDFLEQLKQERKTHGD